MRCRVLCFLTAAALFGEAQEKRLSPNAFLSETLGVATALFGLAFTSHDTAQYAKEAEFAGRGLEIDQRLGDARGESDALSGLGLSFVARGDNERARENFLAMLQAARKTGDRLRSGCAQ